MKIAFVGGRGLPETYSGVEVFLKELCPLLVLKGHSVTVYCRPSYYHIDSYRGVKLVCVSCIDTRLFGTITHSFLSTLKALQDKADIIHFNAVGPSAFSIIPRVFRIPTIATKHSLIWQHSKWSTIEKGLIKGIECFASRIPTRVVAVAKQHQSYLQKEYGKKVYHIPNGVHIMPSKAPNKILALGLIRNNFILYAGRLSPEKGCHNLIDAYNKIKTEVKLVIAGASNDESYFKVLKNKANKNIIFLGHVSTDILAELYSNALVYILPSESEGLSISLLEAMSYGCCVLTSSITENLDVIADCGIAFEPGNVEMLSNKLNLLLKDRALIDILGCKALDRVKRLFNWDDVCEEYQKLYRDVIQDKMI